jgi:hypothetical protein
MKWISILRTWLQANWIFVSVGITAIPLVYKGFTQLNKIETMLESNYAMSNKIVPMIPKLDTIFIRQRDLLDDIKSIKLSNKNRDRKDSVMIAILKDHTIKEAKTKEDLLKAINSFGQYWNVNYPLDSSKKKTLPSLGKITAHKNE